MTTRGSPSPYVSSLWTAERRSKDGVPPSCRGWLSPRAGQRLAVWFDPADRTKWTAPTALDEAATPQVRRLWALAQAGGPEHTVDRLAKLDELRRSGALTQTEFEALKARILDDGADG